MMRVRSAQDRGHSQYSWLDSWHSFSFANYFDPEQMGFSVLRVINEDTVVPGKGFPTHAHRDMEIISYVLEGSIEHKDSMGHVSRLKAGEVQRMTAGTGVTHSEYNPSREESLKFLQIWIEPERTGLAPGYEQLQLEDIQDNNGLKLLASRDGRDGSMLIHQDVALYSATVQASDTIDYGLAATRKAYVHVVRGEVAVNDRNLSAGDAVTIVNEGTVHISTETSGEVLLFDLP